MTLCQKGLERHFCVRRTLQGCEWKSRKKAATSVFRRGKLARHSLICRSERFSREDNLGGERGPNNFVIHSVMRGGAIQKRWKQNEKRGNIKGGHKESGAALGAIKK